ncbi:MAG: helix-turn-helix domain-containing protein [Chloroflexi bacterium]|nr:MAG: helix-turn-helix domain-containing protein [Chloroflexota bacterium]
MSNELGQWIEKERKKRGWSQRKLAQEAGISQAPISRIINKVAHENEQICGEKVAQALARAFGANPVYVFRLARILKPPSTGRDFSTWLAGELEARKMSPKQLGKKAGLEAEVVADLTSGVPPTFEVAEKLAAALELDRLYVQQLAGLLPPGEEALSNLEIDLLHDYRALNKGGRQIVHDVVKSVRKNFG